MSTTYRYRFDGFDAATLTEWVNSMNANGAGIAIASAPSGVYVDVSVPDGLDVAFLDNALSYPIRWTNIGTATTPNIRVATLRAKRNAAFAVTGSFTQLPWDAASTLMPASGLSISGGDLVPAVSGIMRIDAQAVVASLLNLSALTMRVVVNPGGSQSVVCVSERNFTSAECNVQFGITAGIPVRIEIMKTGGIGNATLDTAESNTFCCANIIVS